MLVEAFDVQTQASRKVLFVSEDNIDLLNYLAVDLLSSGQAAVSAPKGRAVVQVVGNDGAVRFGCMDSFQCQICRGIAERGENAAGMEPTRAQFTEQLLPI